MPAGRGTPRCSHSIALLHGLTLGSHPGPTGDNAEFQYLGRALGVSHPTGYPLYLMTTHVFQALLPWGTLAWKINLFSLLCGLAALGCLLGLGRRLGLPFHALAPAAAWLAISPTWWKLCTVAEVYALHAAFTFATLWLFTAWAQTRDPRRLKAGIALHALSYGNHLSTIFLLPVLIFIVWRTDRSSLRSARLWAWAAAWIVLGAATYAYVVVRSSGAPDMAAYTRVTSWPEFLAYVTGAQFRAAWRGGFHGSTQSGGPHACWSPSGAGPRCWPPRVSCMPRCGCEAPGSRYCWPACCNSFLLVAYRIPDIADYLLPLSGLAALWLAAGLHALARPLNMRTSVRRWLPAAALMWVAGATALAAPRGSADDWRRASIAEAGRVRSFMESARLPTYLVCPDWARVSLARYHLFAKPEAPPVRVMAWTRPEIEALTPKARRDWIRHKLSLFHDVVFDTVPGHPSLDLRPPLEAAGVRFESRGDSYFSVSDLAEEGP
jgi:hypothetical protein